MNDSQPRFVVELVRRAVGDLRGKRITALGLSYKPDVDELRESPAVEVYRLLAESSAKVIAYEPFKPAVRFEQFQTATDLDSAIADAEVLLLLVRHTQLVQLDPVVVVKKTSARLMCDLVMGWNEKSWKAAGCRFMHLGGSAML